MTFIKKQWLLPLLLAIIVLIIGVIFIQGLFSKDEQMTKEEVEQQLVLMYGGTVEDLTFQDEIYSAEITRSGGIYSAKVNATNGQVLGMTLIEKIEEEAPKLLSEQEVKDMIGEKYHNDVEGLTLNEEGETPTYEVEVAKNQTLLKVIVNAQTGEVMKEEEQPSSTKNTLITREEAIEIALGQLYGEVEYVKFIDNEDGGYYLVEIEQDRDDDDIEAVFQIHAITGKIMTIEWDD